MLLLFPCNSLLFLLIVLLLICQQKNAVSAAGNWPCPIGPSPTCPGYPRLSCSPLSYSCPPPQCQSDAQCSPLRCKLAAGICEDYPEPKAAGTKCTQHRECGMEMICVDGKCEEGAKSGRTGSYRSCTKSIECPSIEDCEQGVCLIRLSSDVNGPNRRTTMRPSTIGENGGGIVGFQREDGLNVWSTGRCSPNRKCGGHGQEEECIQTDGQWECFPRTFFNLQGQLIPPPPGHPYCRDANSPPAQPSEHCQRRKWLCRDGLYWELMGEQCARSCGRCEDLGVVEGLLREGKVQTRILMEDWVKRGIMAGERRNMEEKKAKWKKKKLAKEEDEKDEDEDEEDEEEEIEFEMEMEDENDEERRREGCIDHWDRAECEKLDHLCANSVYRKQLARFCARTCRHC